ncbi:serine/threonine protein kinase, putative [Plasmodium malariae]|uniref:non-specific serine/threonine protein kinase n=1 Tax=Plasmodium malariae TaxID=5858 RepID=A0A1D3TFK3_PLAMA|nr:serine/threonine protein kinase, putative [Plasmodium malariae]SCP03746.1 serine/threonine protein kinase, putative [Plasmodium malariae]
MLKFRSICTTLIGGKIYNINGRTIREEKLLSEGAYSFVYLAKDLNTNKIYSIKKTICQDKEKLEMAKKEINILKSLPPHKNIVQYYGSTVIAENNYRIVIMLMEYCEKGNLLNIFEKNKDKIKENHIVKILKDIITGLHFLHTQEIPIIHRDIKLENILCDNNGVYKICDFCSHTISNSIFPNDLVKNSFYILKEEIERDTTLIYRPPELIDLYSNLEISCKVDLWMVGCILYLLLFKIHPFQNNNNNLLSIINGSFTIPYNSKYSKRIISILLMTLNKNPQKRIDSTTLLFILENYADLKTWFMHIPADIKRRVNQIFEKMNELNLNNKKNELIEISSDKIVDVKISSKEYQVPVPKSSTNFLKFFSAGNTSADAFKKRVGLSAVETATAATSTTATSTAATSTAAISTAATSTAATSTAATSTAATSTAATSTAATSTAATSTAATSTATTSTAATSTDASLPGKGSNVVNDITQAKGVKLISIENITSAAVIAINDAKENVDLLNLDTKFHHTVVDPNENNKKGSKNNENILKDVQMDKDLNLFEMNCSNARNDDAGSRSIDVERNDQINRSSNDVNNSFNCFFDPWSVSNGSDVSASDKTFLTSLKKNSNKNFSQNGGSSFLNGSRSNFPYDGINFQNDGDFKFENSCTLNNCTNNFNEWKDNRKNCSNINDAFYNLDYFEEIDHDNHNDGNKSGSNDGPNNNDDGKNRDDNNIPNFDGSKTKTEEEGPYNWNNSILNDFKKRSSSKLIASDKNDKFSELLEDFQKTFIK